MNTHLLTHIPLDKSWLIRMGVLDLLHNKDTTIQFLEKMSPLSEDLAALHRVSKAWQDGDKIDVGESGTLYRFLQFLSWKHGLDKEFVLQGTLKTRKITRDPKIVSYTIAKLLMLDNQTSQWASASVLCGNPESRMDNPPFKLALTYEAVSHWQECHANEKVWQARYDETIEDQAKTFLNLLRGANVTFTPKQAEDYCFARVLNFISAKEGLRLWPSLAGHESNRIEEMEHVINAAALNHVIASNDHRVVQAMAMWAAIHDRHLSFLNPDCVSKSWPQFWDFIDEATI